MNKIEKMLSDEIVERIEELNDVDLTSDEGRMLTDNIKKLVDARNDLAKTEAEIKEKGETELKKAKSEQVYRIVDYAFKGANLGIGVWAFVKTLKFDDSNTVTSTNGRRVIGSVIDKCLFWK